LEQHFSTYCYVSKTLKHFVPNQLLFCFLVQGCLIYVAQISLYHGYRKVCFTLHFVYTGTNEAMIMSYSSKKIENALHYSAIF